MLCIGDDFLLLGDQFVVGGDECRLDFLFGHMGCLAFLSVVLAVATVDDSAVSVGGVPYLRAKP